MSLLALDVDGPGDGPGEGQGDMAQGGFTAREVLRLTGLRYHHLRFWSDSGFLRAELGEAGGCGTRRRYSFRDVIALRCVRNLRAAGVSLQKLRKVRDVIEALGLGSGTPFVGARLVIIGSDVLVAHGVRELISCLRQPGQTVAFVVDLEHEAGVVQGMMRAA